MLWQVLLLAGAVTVVGQTALKDALGLTEQQMWQLRQAKPARVAPDGGSGIGIPFRDSVAMRPYQDSLNEALHNPILDQRQQAKLAKLVMVLDRWNMASEAIILGLIDVEQWPGSMGCFGPHASELDISESQRQELDRIHEKLKELIAKKNENLLKQRLLARGQHSAEIAQLTAEVSKLRREWAAEPLRSRSRAVLNAAQAGKLAALENDLELAREAIELHLVPDPPKGEALCM
jgi:hypothetical protein